MTVTRLSLALERPANRGVSDAATVAETVAPKEIK